MNDYPNADLYAEWPEGRRTEIFRNWQNREVGSRIVSETDRLRVWHLHLEPGERLPFHRHVADYFWTVLGDGKARSYYGDGSVRIAEYKAGDTQHFEQSEEDSFIHDLENIGETPLIFVTVEHLEP